MVKKMLKEELKRIKASLPDRFREFYEIGFRDGLASCGRGGRMKPDGMSYDGDVNADGQPHGYGVMKWTNGRRYEGKVRDGKPHGYGVMKWADGRRHRGKFRKGAPVETTCKARYDGDVNADGQPHGYGVMTWPDGRRYEGKVRDGQPHGSGVMTWADGKRYSGKFRKGAPVEA